MFSLKMSLKEKGVTELCITVVCYLTGERECGELDYVNLYFALFFVDYWKNLQKHVSVVRLGVVVEVVCLVLWLLVRKIMNLRFWDCHAGGNGYIVIVYLL